MDAAAAAATNTTDCSCSYRDQPVILTEAIADVSKFHQMQAPSDHLAEE